MELSTHAKQAIRRYISLVGTLQKQMGRLGFPVDDPLQDAVWKVVDALHDQLDDRYGLGGWLTWYQYECELGEAPQLAGCEGDRRRIRTVEDLFWLIEQAESEYQNG